MRGKRVAAPAGKSFLHLGNGLGELRPDVVAERRSPCRGPSQSPFLRDGLKSSYCGWNGNPANAATEAGKSLLARSENSASYSGNSGVGSVASSSAELETNRESGRQDVEGSVI